MIARLTGQLTEKQPSSIILETSGIGFEVLISSRTFEKLPAVQSQVTLNIYTHLREDEIKLVGFIETSEKEFFLRLLGVSGISVKIALAALSIYSARELKNHILKNDVDMVKRVPGIGKKLAERMILELKDRFQEGEAFTAALSDAAQNNRISEVKEALKALGYSTNEISNVLYRININKLAEARIEDILKLALKEI